jgi:hypothetical protein
MMITRFSGRWPRPFGPVAGPNPVQRGVLADDAVSVRHKIGQQVEHQRLQRDGFGAAAQLPLIDIKHMAVKQGDWLKIGGIGARRLFLAPVV